MEIYLISSTKYKAYRTIQTDSLVKYLAKLNDSTNAKYIYPKMCFLEFIKTQR